MRILRELDYLLLAATLVMVLLGVTMIYSAAFYSDSVTVQTAWDRQAKFAFLALAVALAIVLNFYNNHLTVDVDRADELRG